MTGAEVSSAFAKYYMQRATVEFSEDLDRIRGAEDFKDDALPLLINALQKGASVFSIEEQQKIVTAGKK
jgi:ribosome assembly protein 3